MTGLSAALCIVCSTTPFFSAAGRPGDPAEARSVSVRAAPASVRLAALSHRVPTAVKLRVGTAGPGQTRRLGVVASADRAEFLEETNEDIYHENKRNPWHAFFLAMAPSLFFKPLAIGLSWHYCDKKENERAVAFINVVPSAGFGSFYSDWYWAGALAMLGDAAGSALLTWYFYDEHQTRNESGGSMTKFYAGIGIAAFFWLFDMIMGPVGALYYNKTLRRRYLSEAPARRIYQMPPLPDTGLATLGPQPSGPAPAVLGYSGRF